MPVRSQSPACRSSVESLKAALGRCSYQMINGGACETERVFHALEAADQTAASLPAAEKLNCYDDHLDVFTKLAGPLAGLTGPANALPFFRALFEEHRNDDLLLFVGEGAWRNHPVEIHLAGLGNDLPSPIPVFHVEKMHDSFNSGSWSSLRFIADAPTSDDPVGHYNCFSLALHTIGLDSVLIRDGCVNREKIPACSDNPQFWPSPQVQSGCMSIWGIRIPVRCNPESPRHPIKSCDAPANHLTDGSWRFVNALEEEILPGDRLIYFNPAPQEILQRIQSDPARASWWGGRHVADFPFWSIEHSAIVFETNGDDIIALHKLDSGPAIVGSAFEGMEAFGNLFVVMRQNDPVFSPAPTTSEHTHACLPENTTLKAAESGDEWALWFARERNMAKIREENCKKNVRICY